MTGTTTRENAWQTLGNPTTGSTAEEVLRETGLAGWNVRKNKLTTTVGGKSLEVPGKFAVIRDIPAKAETGDGSEDLRILGVVGNHYHPVQNEELAGFMDTLVDEAGANYDRAGSLAGGRRVFVSMKLPDSIQVGGIDPVDLYLTAFNSNDGQSSFSFVITPVRTWCANMQAVATKEALGAFKVRHTPGGASAKVQEARLALSMTFKYQAEFEREAQALMAQSYTDQQFSRLTASLFPTPDNATDKRKENVAVHRSNLSSLFRESDTAENIRGTRWAAFQAVTEYTDHIVAKQGVAGEALRVKRATEAINPRSNHSLLKARAYQLLTK